MTLPHTVDKLVKENLEASEVMRAWMESVDQKTNNIEFVYTPVSGDITTTGSQFLRVTTACTITLNPSPSNGETLQIQPDGNFTVTISGVINGSNPSYMHVAYDFLEIRYVEELGEWVG